MEQIPKRVLAAPSFWVLAIAGTVSAAIAYVAASQFDLYDGATGGTDGDSAIYTAMSRGMFDVDKPYRYRVIIPWLVHLLPSADTIGVSPDRYTQFVFAGVNGVCLTLTALVMYLLARRCGFTPGEATGGGLMLFASWVTVRFSAAVLVDAPSYLVLVLAMYLAVTRRFVAFGAALLVGVFVKETALLAVITALLCGGARSERVRCVVAALPAIAVYLLARYLFFPTDDGYTYGLSSVEAAFRAIGNPGQAPRLVVELVLTFGALWLLWAIGVRANRTTHEIPQQLAWVVPIVLLVPFVIGSNYGRIWFYAFPVIILFSLVALRRITVMHNCMLEPENQRSDLKPLGTA